MPWWRTEGTCHYPSLGGGGVDEGYWDRRDRNVYLHAAEHSGAVHSYLPHSVTILGYG